MRVPLHSGLPTGRKAFIVCAVAMLMLFAGPMLAFVLSVPALDVPWLGWTLLALIEAGGVLTVIAVFRYAAWLEHTTLVVRRTFRTRRCDLAAAPQLSVVARTAQGYPRPELSALDAQTGRWVSVMLHKPATLTLLEPHALRALADAMLAGSRPQERAQYVWQLAQGLYNWANDPFAGMR